MFFCKDCKYWRVDQADRNDNLIQPVDPDTGEDQEMPFEVRYCKNPKLLKFERPIDETYAAVVDGSDYKAELATGPLFSCIHFEVDVDLAKWVFGGMPGNKL